MNTLAAFEKVQGNNPDGTPNSSYIDLLNMTDYIDYMLLNFYIGNTDWPWHNFYAAINTADPTGFDFFSWDAEMSLGIENGGFNSSVTANVLGPTFSGGQGVGELYGALYSNPEFDMAFADQARQFLFDNGAMTPAASIARYQAQINEISQAMVAESARWGDIPTSPGPLPNTQAAWLNEANYITGTYLPQRTGILISQLQAAGLYPTLDAPEYYVNGVDEYGGIFNPGDQLTMSSANLPAGAVIYYTLDGTDPRLVGGAVNTASDVFTYSGPITLTQGEEVRARVYSDGTWSAISEADFTVDLSSVRITELMYDPVAATPAEIAAGYTSVDGSEDFEFIEIQNTSSTALPLQGLQFTNGVTFTFPERDAGRGALHDRRLRHGRLRYSLRRELQAEFGANWQSLIVAGQYSGHLDNSGEEVQLASPNGGVLQDFTYSPDWYPQTAGGGFSLTVRSTTQAPSLLSSAAGWVPSGEPGGTPGTAELISTPLPGSIVINEVLANPLVAGGDMIELHNTTSQAINIGGWWLSDGSTNLTMYQIAANTMIAAGGYLVETDTNNYGAGIGRSGRPHGVPLESRWVRRVSVVECQRRRGRLSGEPVVRRYAGRNLRRAAHRLDRRHRLRAAFEPDVWNRPELQRRGQRRHVVCLADRHQRVDVRSGAADGRGNGRRLHRCGRFRIPRALQPFGDDAVAGQLLSRQWSRLHVRLVWRRRERRIRHAGKRRHGHLVNQRSRRRNVHRLCRLQPHRSRRQCAVRRHGGAVHDHLSGRIEDSDDRPGHGRQRPARFGPAHDHRRGPDSSRIDARSDGDVGRMDDRQSGRVRGVGRRSEGRQPRAEFVLDAKRPDDASSGGLRRFGQRLRGVQLPLQHRRQPNSGGRCLQRPPKQQRRIDGPVRRRAGESDDWFSAVLSYRRGRLQRRRPLADSSRRRRTIADSAPPGRLRQRSRQLDGEQRRRHARSSEYRLRSVAADRAHQSGFDRQRELQSDRPHVDRIDRHAQRRRSLRDLSQRRKHWHVANAGVHRHHGSNRDQLHLHRQRRQPRWQWKAPNRPRSSPRCPASLLTTGSTATTSRCTSTSR